MSDTDGRAQPAEELLVTDERLKKAEEFIEEEEGAVSRFQGWLDRATTGLLVVMSLFHLYAAVEIVPAQVLRPVHVGFVLLLVYLLFPVIPRFRNRLRPVPAYGRWKGQPLRPVRRDGKRSSESFGLSRPRTPFGDRHGRHH